MYQSGRNYTNYTNQKYGKRHSKSGKYSNSGNSTIVIGDYVYPYPLPFDIGMPYMQQINNQRDFKNFLKLIKELNPRETSEGKIINLISALLLKNKKMDDFDLPNTIVRFLNIDNSIDQAKLDLAKDHIDDLNTVGEVLAEVKYGQRKRKQKSRQRKSKKKSRQSKRKQSKRN